jgi:CHAT domain-containing protein/Flp pilus assembly protein TadD
MGVLSKPTDYLRILPLSFLIISSFLPALTLGEEAESPAAFLETRIDSLRTEARYTEALAVARELLDLRQADDSTKAYKIADTERLVETLEYIVSMPVDSQAELAEADKLTEVVRQSYYNFEEERALTAARKQIEIYRKLLGNDHHHVAESLSRAGVCLYGMSDYASAERVLREALDINRAILGNKHPRVARVLYFLALVLHGKGDYAEVEGLYRQALAITREALGSEHPYVAEYLGSLAFHLQYAKSDYLGAESASGEALAIFRKLYGDEDPRLSGYLTTLGEILAYGKGDYSGGEALCREALAISEKAYGHEHYEVAWCLQMLGCILDAKGDYASAEPMLRDALAIRRRLLGNESDQVAWSLRRLGGVLYTQGDYAGAEPLYAEALAIFREVLGDEHHDVAGVLVDLGKLLRAKGDYAGAERSYREALGIYKKCLGNEHQDVARNLHNLANLLYAKGDYDEAESLFREALAIQRRVSGEESSHVAHALQGLAWVLAAKGDYAAAEPLYQKALPILTGAYGNEHPSVVWNLRNQARLLCEMGNYRGAESLLVEAGRAYEPARLRAGTGTERATFGYSPYSELAAVRLILGDSVAAWTAVERDLGRVLADFLMTADQRSLTPFEKARGDSLKRLLGNLEGQLAALRESAWADTTGAVKRQVEMTRTRLLDVEVEWSEFQSEIAEKYPVSEGQAFPLERVQAALGEDMAILGWLDMRLSKRVYASWAYVIRRGGPVVWARIDRPSGQDRRFATEQIGDFRSALTSPQAALLGVKQDAEDLWTRRIAPLAHVLRDVRRLIVIPSGSMLGVPVEALVDAKGLFLGDRFSISYIPSATIHTWLNEQPPVRTDSHKGKVLLVGDPPFTHSNAGSIDTEMAQLALGPAVPMPDYSVLRDALGGNDEAIAALPRLPGSREETRKISSVAPQSTLLLGKDASEQELERLAETKSLGDFYAIHVATHALIDDESPERSALVLSQVGLPDALEAAMSHTRMYDGLVTAKEILNEWELEADLVTLSACQTGLGRKVRGEGYVGFSHAFFQAGARSLLVSLWKVEDRATSKLMERFYNNYFGRVEDEGKGRRARPMAKAEALQEAKQWLRNYTDEDGKRPYEHPYYWAAFILIGDRGR